MERYQVKSIDGQLFVMMSPYRGDDEVWIEWVGRFIKPCKILGPAKKGTTEKFYSKETAEQLIDNGDS